MQDHTRIRDLPALAGQTVTLRGWVTTTRSSGKIAFVVVRDGTGQVQVVASKAGLPDATWEAIRALTQEASVSVTGEVRILPYVEDRSTTGLIARIRAPLLERSA